MRSVTDPLSTNPSQPASSRSRDLALIAVFAALIAVLGLPGMIAPFGNAVPITLQTFGVMLAASVLGARRGALSVLLLLVLVAAGLPLLAGGRGGLGVFVGPSAGFLIGWVVGAFVTGLIIEKAPRYGIAWAGAANVVGCIVVMYAIGIPVQAYITGTTVEVAAIASLVFIPGDLVKVVLATVIAAGVHRAVPDLRRAARPTRPGV